MKKETITYNCDFCGVDITNNCKERSFQGVYNFRLSAVDEPFVLQASHVCDNCAGKIKDFVKSSLLPHPEEIRFKQLYENVFGGAVDEPQYYYD